MDFHVSLTGRGDLAAQIYRQLLDAILDGRLRPGERLPPTRELARRLDVSRNTAAVAYDRLTAEGFLAGRVGDGTFVRTALPGRVRSRGAPSGRVRPRRLWRDITAEHEFGAAEPAPYDFRVGVPDPRLFPLETWRRLVARELRASTVHATGYRDPAGHAGLRAAIARHTGVARSVRAAPDDVIITQGAQQALDLIGRILIEPGDQVAVEEPGYPPARLAFRAHGARVIGVPVDAEGIDVSAIPPSARIVYVTPSHQFPLGTPMSLARRAALLTWADRHGAVIIEDDYDSEFRFGERPLEPLQSLDAGGNVVYVGSFSKTLLPMLRLGFLVAPASLGPALRTAKGLADWHGDVTTQAATGPLHRGRAAGPPRSPRDPRVRRPPPADRGDATARLRRPARPGAVGGRPARLRPYGRSRRGRARRHQRSRRRGPRPLLRREPSAARARPRLRRHPDRTHPRGPHPARPLLWRIGSENALDDRS